MTATTLDRPERASDRKRKAKRSPVRTLFTLTGIGMILAGLGVLAYLAWEFYGTNIIAERNQREQLAQIEQAWADDIPGDAVGILRVPAFGDDYVQPILVGFSDQVLRSGVGWYEHGARPGEAGNVVIAGHRVTNGEPFRDLPSLRPGDTVEIETKDHLYIYELETSGDEIRVPYTTSWPLMPIPDEQYADGFTHAGVLTENYLTLITCSELFSTPLRNVVIGKQIEVIDKSAAT